MFLLNSAPLYRVQENRDLLNIFIWINNLEFSSLLHCQSHSLHHFRLNIHQGFHIRHVTIYPPHLLENYLQRIGYFCQGLPMLWYVRNFKGCSGEHFHNDATMLHLRICHRKTKLHRGSAAIQITLFSLAYFLS